MFRLWELQLLMLASLACNASDVLFVKTFDGHLAFHGTAYTQVSISKAQDVSKYLGVNGGAHVKE